MLLAHLSIVPKSWLHSLMEEMSNRRGLACFKGLAYHAGNNETRPLEPTVLKILSVQTLQMKGSLARLRPQTVSPCKSSSHYPPAVVPQSLAHTAQNLGLFKEAVFL